VLIKRLTATLNGRVAVVSGRMLEDLDRILERGVTPVAAVHG
jgi:trehalose 6-phosphate phosphatase